ncbi:MAG: endonuclease IV [Peptococcaceae bacterium BICA1-7]|nr:MAG: endonuclease IV [Peptococcaceae bacterium BICA1-7]HBV97022.1 endonuclease IV [Desulfotomaculum sp.]
MHTRFGPAGNSNSFYGEGHKSSLDMPRWLREKGLNAYEYQCSRGVNIGEETARELGRKAAENGIYLSIHAPYYINLATPDPEGRVKTRQHLMKTLLAARWMGARVVVFHPGSGKDDRSGAMKRATAFLREISLQAREEGLDDIMLAPETMGKKNLLGSLEEVMELCGAGPNIIPAIDFGHLHAVTQGGFGVEEAFAGVFDKIVAVLGKEALKRLHIHFSPVEYTSAGEKKHMTTRDEGYGPDFSFLAALLASHSAEFTVICESDGCQAEDALIFKSIYEEALKANSLGIGD